MSEGNGEIQRSQENGGLNAGSESLAEICQNSITKELSALLSEEGVEVLTEYIWHMITRPKTTREHICVELREFLDSETNNFVEWLVRTVGPLLKDAHPSVSWMRSSPDGEASSALMAEIAPSSAVDTATSGTTMANDEKMEEPPAASPAVSGVAAIKSGPGTFADFRGSRRIANLAVKQATSEANIGLKDEVSRRVQFDNSLHSRDSKYIFSGDASNNSPDDFIMGEPSSIRWRRSPKHQSGSIRRCSPYEHHPSSAVRNIKDEMSVIRKAGGAASQTLVDSGISGHPNYYRNSISASIRRRELIENEEATASAGRSTALPSNAGIYTSDTAAGATGTPALEGDQPMLPADYVVDMSEWSSRTIIPDQLSPSASGVGGGRPSSSSGAGGSYFQHRDPPPPPLGRGSGAVPPPPILGSPEAAPPSSGSSSTPGTPVVVLDPKTGQAMQLVPLSRNAPSALPKIRKRCARYPDCPFGEDCRFIHPADMCLNWPNCSFGDECFYIHPQVPCKYGVNCCNWYCNYTHPEGRRKEAFHARYDVLSGTFRNNTLNIVENEVRETSTSPTEAS